MKLALISGDYQARSVIASAQRCLNLYGERNADDAPYPYTYYPRAGLTQLIAGSNLTQRCSYQATDGSLYEVVGPNVYHTNAMWGRTLLGQIANGTMPVSLSDNGLAGIIVDGSPNGWCWDMSNPTPTGFAAISGQNGAFYGADRVDVVDTFFVLNVPGTNEWYVSLSEVDFANLTGTVSPDMTAAAFDPLDIAAKTGNPDPIQSAIVMHREIWLIGTQTTEVWYDAGNADFAFSELPGVFIEHGCIAKHSICKQDLSIYWLSSDRQGNTIVLTGNQYSAKRISTHAIEQQIQSYATVSDAVGYTYQQLGHVFYVLTFPTADATWVYDAAEGMWHEETWTDTNGLEHRIRANNAANVYGTIVCGDWQTGALYKFDPENFTDNGVPIQRRRGFPIVRDENDRLSFSRIVLDLDTGNAVDAQWTYPGAVSPYWLDSAGNEILDSSGNPIFLGYSLGTGSAAYPVPFGPNIGLRYSNNGGHSWGNPLTKGMGATGQFDRSVVFNQLGMGRRRVFELFWDAPCFVALNGADLFFEKCET